MRRAEILSIEWNNVYLSKRLLYIPDTKNGESRTIPLSMKAVNILQGLQSINKEEPFPITRNVFRHYWIKLTSKANIEDLHFHDLRHEAISRFFERGLSVPEVALISGHKDMKMLFRYTHMKAENIVNKL